MKIFSRFVSTAIILFLLMPVAANAQVLTGTWQGRISFLGKALRIVFHFKETAQHTFTATTDSPDQGMKGEEVDDVDVRGDSLIMQMYSLHGEYAGAYNPDSQAYIGVFKQYAFKLPLKLIKGDADDLLYHRPQKPRRPFPYLEEEVIVHNRIQNLDLAGTFTKPGGKGKFPAAILITGSGAEDRDESVMGHKPFFILSDYLTRHGFAVLRCDDRGTAKSTGTFSGSTSADFATDVEAQLEYLETRPDVDRKKIGLIGHSEGGIIAPLVASERKDVAFVVLMAGPAIGMFDLLLLQDSLVSVADGNNPDQVRRFLNKNKKLFGFLQSTKDSATAADSIDQYLTNRQTAVPEIQATLELLNSRWMRWFIGYDPRVALRKLTCPVLAINGEKDVQVPAYADIASIEQELTAGGNKNFKTAILPGLNHLFQQCNKCSVSEYVDLEETMNPLALRTIGDWMEEQFLKKHP